LDLRIPTSLLLLIFCCSQGCADVTELAIAPPTEDRLLDEPLGELPVLLSQVGVYDNMVDLEEVDARAMAYAPSWPLWSSGSDKERLFVLPEGATIHNPAGEIWMFPPGTLLFKTFSFFDGAGRSRPVETRLIRALADGDWDYAVWLWNASGTDAELLELKKTLPVNVMNQEGEAFEHVVPNRLQCRKCHEADPAIVLGLSELQLGTASGDQPSALDNLALQGAFSERVSDAPEALVEDDPLTRWVIGYAQGNCVHCHNGLEGPANSFDLHHSVFLDNTVGAPTESTWGIGLRVVPGDPGESMLFVGMSGETDDSEVKDMPPVGVALRDTEAVEKYREWILSLSTESELNP